MLDPILNTPKYTIEDFRLSDAADNLLSLWTYNYLKEHTASCFICKTYSNFYETVLEEQWSPNWGDFKFVTEKVKNTDKSFIDLSKFSSMNWWEIFDVLIKKNKENKN